MEGSVVTAILAVCTAVGEWFISAVTMMTALFWSNGALTFIGTLTVMGLALAIILLVIAAIRSALKLR